MNTFEQLYTDALALVLATPANGLAVTFPPDHPDCVCAFLTYTSPAGRTLTVTLQYGDTAGNWYNLPADSTADVTAGSTIMILSIGGAPKKIRLQYVTAGGAGADDTLTVKLSGLPTGTTIL